MFCVTIETTSIEKAKIRTPTENSCYRFKLNSGNWTTFGLHFRRRSKLLSQNNPIRLTFLTGEGWRPSNNAMGISSRGDLGFMGGFLSFCRPFGHRQKTLVARYFPDHAVSQTPPPRNPFQCPLQRVHRLTVSCYQSGSDHQNWRGKLRSTLGQSHQRWIGICTTCESEASRFPLTTPTAFWKTLISHPSASDVPPPPRDWYWFYNRSRCSFFGINHVTHIIGSSSKCWPSSFISQRFCSFSIHLIYKLFVDESKYRQRMEMTYPADVESMLVYLGPPSTTLNQRKTNIDLTYCVSWIETKIIYFTIHAVTFSPT